MINCNIVLLDVNEGGEHGSAYFTLTDDFVKEVLKNKTDYTIIDKVLDEVLSNIYEQVGFIGDKPAYCDVDYMSDEAVLPDKVNNLKDLHNFLFKLTDEACCIGINYF